MSTDKWKIVPLAANAEQKALMARRSTYLHNYKAVVLAAPESPYDMIEREEVEKLRERVELYNELLYQVQNKIPGETRHQTAARIIHQHETRFGNGPCASEPCP